MNENKEGRNNEVCLFDEMDEEDTLKSNNDLFDDDNLQKHSPIYEKTEDELFIATSPSFPVPENNKISESISHFYDNDDDDHGGGGRDVEFTKVKPKEKCNSPPNISLNTVEFDSIDISGDATSEYIPLKISPDTFSVLNTIDGHNYFVSTDYTLGNEVSKAYFYVLSPIPNTHLTHAHEDENMSFDANKLISETDDVTNDIPSSHEVVVSTKTNPLNNDDVTTSTLDKFHHGNENNNETSSESGAVIEKTSEIQQRLPTNEFVNINSHFSDEFSTSMHSSKTSSGENQFVLHRIQNVSEAENVKKSKDESHHVLMKVNTEAKLHLPLLNAQPYLQIALNSDLEPSNESELVSANQILDVPIPEVFSCKWEGCSSHKLSREYLIQHVNNNHIVADEDMMYHCLWKDCVRYGKPFNARYKMLIHLRTHTGEKPHVCNIFSCQQAFARIENLKIHQRSHTGEKPYHCQYEGCGRTFANSSDRFKHKRTHTEKRPYKCSVAGCGKSYTDPSSLRKHKKKLHDKTDRANKQRFGVS